MPFDIRSDRYLSFATTEDSIKAMLPLLTQRLWDGLEKSQWFVIGEGEAYFVGRLEGHDTLSTFNVEVRPTAFVEQQFGPKAGRVHVDVTIVPVPAPSDLLRPKPLKCSLGCEDTFDLGSLPWRLKFHKFEANKARFCVEPTGRR